jgi:hypothetical protein
MLSARGCLSGDPARALLNLRILSVELQEKILVLQFVVEQLGSVNEQSVIEKN